jgi:cardiolipin synthase
MPASSPLAPIRSRLIASLARAVAIATAMLMTGCSTASVPNAFRMMRARWAYREGPQFVGSDGPLTRQQGEAILERMAARSGTSPSLLQRHLAFEQAISGEPLILGNRVTLLENGPPTYAAMLKAIDSAKDSINLETFTFTDDSIGREFADALIARQHHGVQVNIIYDSAGSVSTPTSFFDRMRDEGIRVLEFNPINPLWARVHWEVEHRDHRKLLVVDGRTAFTGGINISGVYASGLSASERTRGGKSGYWRDTDLEIEGPAAAQCQELFIATWTYQHGPLLPARDYYPSLGRQGHDIVRMLGSVPELFPTIYVTLISAINNAENNVWITEAYFAPDPQMIRVLEQSARRGVDVRLLLPSNADEPLIQSAARSYYSELMAAGVKIYEWRGEMLHAKTATVDGVWSAVGSSNLDTWSIARNNEIDAVILSPEFGNSMNVMFEQDLRHARRIDPETWPNRGIIERTEERIARLVQPLL